MRMVSALVGVLLLAVMGGAAGAPSVPKPESVAIPDGERGIGYDDLQYAPDLNGSWSRPVGRAA